MKKWTKADVLHATNAPSSLVYNSLDGTEGSLEAAVEKINKIIKEREEFEANYKPLHELAKMYHVNYSRLFYLVQAVGLTPLKHPRKTTANRYYSPKAIAKLLRAEAEKKDG